MRHSWTMAAFGVLALLVSSLGHAQDASGPDEVTLKNGGTVRGTVVSSEPGVSVKIIEMGGKEARVIPWSEVSDIERGKYLPRTQTQPGPAGPGYGVPPPQPVAPPPPQLGAPGVIRLHIESPEPVRIIEHTPVQYAQVGAYGIVIEQVRQVCESPCDQVIDGSRGQLYTASGNFPGRKEFSVAGQKGDLELNVEPGSNAMRSLGILGTSLGGGAVLAGVLVLVITSRTDLECDASGCHDAPSKPVHPAAIGLLIGGGVGLVGGIVLIAASGTSWDLHPKGGAPGGKAAKAGAPRYYLGEF